MTPLCHPRCWILAAGLAALGICAAGAARSQAFPTKPLRIIVAFPAGSSTDGIARAVGEQLRAKFGQPVVIDNRSGANGAIGVTEAARATADGYTLLATNSSSITVNHQIYRKLGYLPERDFVPLSMVVSAPFFLAVNPGGRWTAGVNTVADLVALARAKPGPITYGSGGPGNLAHLAFEMINNRAEIKTVHVPYKSGMGAQLALLGKEVDAHLAAPSVVPVVRAGKLRALSVTTAKRWHELPEVPTMIESGYAGFDVPFWLGIMAPARTPPNLVRVLYEAIAAVPEDSNAMRQLRALGSVELLDPQTFAKRIRAETASWAEVIKRENIQLD